MPSTNRLSDVIAANADAILPEWMRHQLAAVTARRDLLRDDELREQSRRFLDLLNSSLKRDGGADIGGPAWGEMRELLTDLSRTRARQGFSPDRDRDVRLLAQAAAVRPPAPRAIGKDAERARRRGVADDGPARQARPLHDRGLPEEPRGGHRPPAAGDARAVDAGRQAVGGHPRAAADRHARQRAHAGRDGEPAASASSRPAPRSRSSTSPACRRSTRWSRSTC